MPAGRELLPERTPQPGRPGRPAERARQQGDLLRRALRDPAVWVADEAAARARYVLCSHVLERIGDAAKGCRAPVLAVKGAALAHTVYPKPWQREMSDIDLIVHPLDRGRLVSALEGAGCRCVPAPAGRRFSAGLLDETALVYSAGQVSWTIEVHEGLDKIVSRPVPYDRIRERSHAVDALAGLRVPALEDHALLVALHASASVTDHPVGLLDLELLLRAGVDPSRLVRRAGRWRLRSALFVCLEQLRALGSQSVAQGTLDALRPGWLRARALTLVGARREGGAERASRKKDAEREEGGGAAGREGRAGAGLEWVARQTPLRDDLLRWVGGVGRYGVLRAADAAARPPTLASSPRVPRTGRW